MLIILEVLALFCILLDTVDFRLYRLAQSVRLCMAIAIFLSYGLQFYVPMNILWPTLSLVFTTEDSKKYGEYCARVTLVFFTCKC